MSRPLLLGLIVLGACARAGTSGGFPSGASARPATDLPERFAPAAAPGAGVAEGTCLSPVRDPRTGVELRFVRAVPGLGDYAVPAGTYGARAGELLRIDCRSWQAVGLVRR